MKVRVSVVDSVIGTKAIIMPINKLYKLLVESGLEFTEDEYNSLIHVHNEDSADPIELYIDILH